MSETTARWYSPEGDLKKKRRSKKIDLEVSRNEWTDIVLQVIVPIERRYIKCAMVKNQTIERNILPGYIPG